MENSPIKNLGGIALRSRQGADPRYTMVIIMGDLFSRQRFNFPARPTTSGFSYSESRLDNLYKTLSAPRLSRYLLLANGNKELALRLYTWNTALSEALYGIVQACEVTLRNTIHDALAEPYKDFWFDEPFMRETERSEIKRIRDGLNQRRKPTNAPDIIAGTTMGFWTGMLAGEYETHQFLPYIRRRFVNAPKKTRRTNIAQEADRVRGLRNRIAHHEPIIHRDYTGDFKSAIKLTQWICADTAEWAEAHCRFKEIAALDPRNNKA